MGLFGRLRDEADDAPPRPRQVFQPEPTDEWGPLVPAPDDTSAASDPPKTAAKKKATPKKPQGKKKPAKKKTFTPTAPKPGLSDKERRLALNAQMTELADALRDAPIEEMEAAIAQTLALHGREVPADWVTTIAEGLRRKGPTPINFGDVEPD